MWLHMYITIAGCIFLDHSSRMEGCPLCLCPPLVHNWNWWLRGRWYNLCQPVWPRTYKGPRILPWEKAECPSSVCGVCRSWCVFSGATGLCWCTRVSDIWHALAEPYRSCGETTQSHHLKLICCSKNWQHLFILRTLPTTPTTCDLDFSGEVPSSMSNPVHWITTVTYH